MEKKQKQPRKSLLKRIRNIILWLIASVILLFLGLFLLFKIPAVQNWAAQKATAYLSGKLETKVEIRSVSIDLFSHVELNGIYVEDRSGDTLLSAEKFEVNLGAINPLAPSVKIKNIQLETAYINLYRNAPDTVFNYEFVMDAFASDDTDTSASKPADIDLQKLNISNTRFRMHDETGLSDFEVYIGSTELKVNELSLPDHVLGIESFSLEHSDIAFTQLLDPDPEEDTTTSPENYDTIHIAIGDWIIEANELNIIESAFFYKDENSTYQTGGINFSDLAVTNINMDMAEITYVGDTINASINELSLQEKSGFKLEHLESSVLFSPYEITLQGLELKTPGSDIGNDLSIKFTTLNDFDRFFSDIYLNAELKNTVIDAADIAYFVPELSQYPAVLAINANITGTLDNLKLKKLDARLNDAAGIKGEASLKGLPDIDETYIDVRMQPLYAEMGKLNSLIGSDVIPPNIVALGSMRYEGRFTGFINDFVLNGSLASSAGNANTDISFQYDKKTSSYAYEGKVQTQDLNIGKLTGNEQLLGAISANAEVKGGVDGNNKIMSTLEAKVEKVTVKGYTYSNISITGKVDDKLFDGYILINDPNLQQEFTGKIDFNSEVPTYDFVSSIKYINPGKLNLYEGDIYASANARINLKGKTLDDLQGEAMITDLVIDDGKTHYALDTFQVTATEDSSVTLLKINSDLVEASFLGNYSLAKLPDAIRDMINIYVNGGDITSLEMQNAQNVDFTVKVKDIRGLTKIFYPDIKEIRNLQIEGQLNTVDKKFYSRTTAEKFIYSNIDVSNTAIEIFTKNNKLSFFTSVKQVNISNNLIIPITVVEGDFSQDSLNINLKVGKDTDPERLNLTAGAFLGDSSIRVSFRPSEIYLSGEKWTIQANNSLFYNYRTLIAENFLLENGEKSIALTSTEDAKYGTLLKVQLKNILIQDITQLLKYNDADIAGSINASVNVSGNFNKPGFVALGSIDNLAINGERIGNTDVSATLIYPNKRLNFNLMVKGENTMQVSGFYHTGNDSLSADAHISKIPLTIAEPFVKGIFSDMYGSISGDVTVRGTASKPNAKGDLIIKKGGLKVDYLGSQFDFAEQRVSITKDKITLEPSVLTDKFKNEAKLSGSISHNYFNDIYFDNITLTSDRLLIMETTQKQNSTLFGKVVASANVVVNGPLENLNVLVNARTLEDDKVESVVYLPVYGSGNVSKHDFIKFVDRSDTDKVIVIDNSVSVVNFDMRLDITPDAKVVILLSSEGSDTLVARGTGNLRIQANTIDKLEMDGTLTIADGSYNFSFESLLQKEFTMQPGGTIIFRRDPYKAILDLTAVYTADNVKRNTLTGDLTDQAVVDIDIMIHITGNLGSPEINFDLKTADQSSGLPTVFEQRLQQVVEDKNELNKQVFGLLIANQFLGQDISSAGGLQGGVSSTMSEFISNQLSRYFTDWLSEIFPGAEIDIKQTTIQSNDPATSEEQRQQFEFGVKQKLLDDRVTVSIGGTYDYTQSAATTNSSNLAGDFEVSYNISRDGTVKIKAFRKSEYDVIGSKNDIKTGLGLFYTKDFNTLADLFAKKEKEVVTQ